MIYMVGKMKERENKNMAEEVAEQFAFEGMIVSCLPYGNGHINDTFKVGCKTEAGKKKDYILQKINTSIFTKPEELMENVAGVTAFLRKRILERGGNSERETLNIIDTKSGNSFYRDSEGECWRAYAFIEDTFSYDLVSSPEDFYQSALAFGSFQELLADYPAESLHETIAGFHDTAARFKVFQMAVKNDVMGRAKEAEKEIGFVLEREPVTRILGDMLRKGELPLRVTHNDTKLNNVLLDKETGKGLCVIDLDTVMPGLALNDFGDSIRFGASTAKEDEQDLEKVSCDMELFEAYVKGFMEACGRSLTAKEKEMLPMGAKVMTLECGMRFLTDYLEGDHYFKTHREKQNLDRCRTQFKLVADMEKKWEIMRKTVEAYS